MKLSSPVYKTLKTFSRIVCCFVPFKPLRHKVRSFLCPKLTCNNYICTYKDIEYLQRYEKFYPHNILSVYDSISNIVEHKKSIARIGDGEFLVMLGQKNVWGNNSETLQKKLLEICEHGSTDKCLVCLNPYHLYGNTSRWFCWYYLRTIEDIIKNIKFNFNTLYGDAYAFHHAVQETINKPVLGLHGKKNYVRVNMDVLGEIKKLWESKPVLFVVNEKSPCIPDELNVFDNCVKREFLFIPPTGAFSKYNEIMAKISQYPKDFLVYLECGEMGTVLAWELSQAGYQAIDMGDFYRRLIDSFKQHK